MYAGRGTKGLGFDWGSLIKTTGNVIGNIVGGGTSTVNPVPVTQATTGIGGISFGTIALLAIGGFVLYNMTKKR